MHDPHTPPPPSHTSAAGFSEPHFDTSSRAAPRDDVNFGAFESLQGAFLVWKEALPRVLLPGAIYFCCATIVGLVVGLASVGVAAIGKADAATWNTPSGWVGLSAAALVVAATGFAIFAAAQGATLVLLDEAGRAVGAPSDIASIMRRLPRLARRAAAATLMMVLPLVVAALVGGVATALAVDGGSAIGVAAGAVVVLGIPASWFMLRLAPLPAVAVLEDRPIVAAVVRTWQLTRGRAGTLFFAYTVFALACFGALLAAMLLSLIPLVGMAVHLIAGAAAFSMSCAFVYGVYVGLVQEADGRAA